MFMIPVPASIPQVLDTPKDTRTLAETENVFDFIFHYPIIIGKDSTTTYFPPTTK